MNNKIENQFLMRIGYVSKVGKVHTETVKAFQCFNAQTRKLFVLPDF